MPVVLVVEDDFLVRESALVTLDHAGFEPLAAANADEAIEILHARQDIDIVFSDIQMAGSMDGVKLVETIRDRWPPIGIVLTSGHGTGLPSSLRERAVFVPKPYRDADLIAAVKSVLVSA